MSVGECIDKLISLALKLSPEDRALVVELAKRLAEK